MTDEEPHGLFRRKVVEAGGFWQIAWLFFTQGFQMASQSLIRMGISQSFDLTPELLPGHLLSLLMENETTRLSGAQTEGRISLSMSKRHIGQKPWLHVVTSLIPTSHDIGLVRIKTTAMPMVVVRFHIRSLREPPLNCSHSQADPLGDLFGLHPLLMERHHLLVARIALGLVR